MFIRREICEGFLGLTKTYVKWHMCVFQYRGSTYLTDSKECWICLEEHSIFPSLDCQHDICISCLEQLYNDDQHATSCGICRQKFTVRLTETKIKTIKMDIDTEKLIRYLFDSKNHSLNEMWKAAEIEVANSSITRQLRQEEIDDYIQKSDKMKLFHFTENKSKSSVR